MSRRTNAANDVDRGDPPRRGDVSLGDVDPAAEELAAPLVLDDETFADADKPPGLVSLRNLLAIFCRVVEGDGEPVERLGDAFSDRGELIVKTNAAFCSLRPKSLQS